MLAYRPMQTRDIFHGAKNRPLAFEGSGDYYEKNRVQSNKGK